MLQNYAKVKPTTSGAVDSQKKKLTERELILTIDPSIINHIANNMKDATRFSTSLENHIKKMLLSPDEHSWASATKISENAVLVFYSRNYFDFVEADVKLDSLHD